MLWVLSVLLVLLRKIEKDRLYAFGEKAALPVLFLLVIPVWGAAQILNTPVICVYRFGIYGICFLLGYYVFSHEKVTDRLACVSVPLATAAVVLAVFCAVLFWGKLCRGAGGKQSVFHFVWLDGVSGSPGRNEALGQPYVAKDSVAF